MEEEEVLTDPKDPLGLEKKLKAKQKQGDPLGLEAKLLKKKEPTVSEPSLNDGSTQAGLDVSQEPGPKGAKPLGKSTESKEQELFNRYSADLEKGLLDLYSKKYKTEEDDFIKSIGGFKEPDLTNKDEVDSYNKKVNQLKEFQQKRGKEIDDEFKNHYETSTQSALERFNKNAIKKANRATEKSPASPFVEELKNAPRPISINPEKDARKIVSQFQTEIIGKPESQGLVQDAYLAASNVPGAINKAFVSGMAATPKTVAMLAQKLDQLTGMPAKAIEEYATYQLGEYVENKAKELGLTVLQNPDYAGFMTSTLPQAVGSMLSMMLLGGRGANTNPFATQSIAKQAATTLTSKTAMVGAMQASVPEFEAAKAAGKTDEEAFNVFLQNIPGGLTESVQMANMFGRLNRMTNNGLMNAIKLSTANGLEEASQEAIQQYLTNKVAQGSYDPERDLKEGMGEGAGAGFIVGFVMPGAMAAMDKMSPEQKTQTKAVLQKMLEQGYYVRTPESFRKTIKSPSQVVSEVRTSVKSADDTQGAENAAEKILEVTQESTKVNQDSANLTLNEENLNKPSIETTGETPSLATESKSLEAPVQEEQGIDQGADMEFTSTVGENYVKRDNRWYVKDAEGIERPLISDNPNKTQEEQNTELAQLKELKTQLETETPVKADLSPTGKSRIAELEAFSPEGRVRKWLFGGGQLLWNSKSQGEGKPTLKGLKDETGYGNKERQDIKQYVHDTDGISVEQAAEQLAAQYQDRSPQEYRNAIIKVFSSDPKKWYEQQVRDEDPDYAMQEEQRFQEAGQLNEQIKQLETQEEGIKETNQQLYENERRVNYGSPAAEGQAAGGQMASPGNGSQTQVQPRESIRKNGDANKSKQALEELQTKNLTHVPGLGMGANQAKGTYVSTEEEGSRYARRGTPVKVKVNVQNPFVSEDDVFYDIQREIIQSRFGKEKIENLTETEADLLAEMVTEHFTTEGFDSIYMPQSETQEGELIVFDRSKVTIMDDARIEYENAVHASTQTTLQLEFIPDAEFLKTDKPIELREKQKKVRKDLARLNQLIKCR